ncbi:unnamed protein product [Linum trigynum]|uniref:Protein MIZU-KUSSEI 1-like n=1 Tax=Linum trigynum TaxID=586398 RepID=A0AAV2GFI8_9ROSI
MGDRTPPRTSNASSNSQTPTPPPPPLPAVAAVSLLQPAGKNKKSKPKVVRVFRSVFRSFPIIGAPACRMPILLSSGFSSDGPNRGGVSGTRVTGTLFGYRKGRVSLSIQETPKCLPSAVVELAMQTSVLQKELGSGMLRIALECEKRADNNGDGNSGGNNNNSSGGSNSSSKTKLLDEPLWTMYCNGKKTGYGVKREATAEDLQVMELLKPVSMGAGVLPGNAETEGVEGELAYMRAFFERVVGSKDSETFYMLSPEGNNGPELTVFFVRV